MTWTHHQRYARTFCTDGSNWSRCKDMKIKLHLGSYLWSWWQIRQQKPPVTLAPPPPHRPILATPNGVAALILARCFLRGLDVYGDVDRPGIFQCRHIHCYIHQLYLPLGALWLWDQGVNTSLLYKWTRPSRLLHCCHFMRGIPWVLNLLLEL